MKLEENLAMHCDLKEEQKSNDLDILLDRARQNVSKLTQSTTDEKMPRKLGKPKIS